MSIKGLKVGSVIETVNGPITVLEIFNSRKVRILFHEYPWETVVTAGVVRIGRVRNRMRPTVLSLGYLGDGLYDSINSPKAYRSWVNMFHRVHNPPTDRVKRCYSDVTISNEWYCFQDFAKWYVAFQNNLPTVNFSWYLDKDLLVPGNRSYGPDVCCLIPNAINCVLGDCAINRGSLPMGVAKIGNKYRANCRNIHSSISEVIGDYDTVKEAWEAYWLVKFQSIQEVGRLFKDCVPQIVANRLMNFGWQEAFEYYGYDTVMGLDTTR